MNKLEMAKAIAKLEGIDIAGFGGDNKINRYRRVNEYGEFCEVYNPIDDLALNCMLRDKYGAMVVYHFAQESYYVSCYGCSEHVELNNTNEIPRAVIECILKANNLWVGS